MTKLFLALAVAIAIAPAANAMAPGLPGGPPIQKPTPVEDIIEKGGRAASTA